VTERHGEHPMLVPEGADDLGAALGCPIPPCVDYDPVSGWCRAETAAGYCPCSPEEED
jgi:hypothetical protein